MDAPAMMTQQVDKVHGRQAREQVLGVEQRSKQHAARQVPPLAHQSQRPHQQTWPHQWDPSCVGSAAFSTPPARSRPSCQSQRLHHPPCPQEEKPSEIEEPARSRPSHIKASNNTGGPARINKHCTAGVLVQSAEKQAAHCQQQLFATSSTRAGRMSRAQAPRIHPTPLRRHPVHTQQPRVCNQLLNRLAGWLTEIKLGATTRTPGNVQWHVSVLPWPLICSRTEEQAVLLEIDVVHDQQPCFSNSSTKAIDAGLPANGSQGPST